jgi:enoyl-CoA hydratase/carnithine racemase
MSGDRIDSKRAYELNLVSHVLENENFNQNVINIVSKISNMSMYSLIAGKEAIRKAEELGIFPLFLGAKEGQEYEKTLFNSLFGLKAKNEGIQAFI